MYTCPFCGKKYKLSKWDKEWEKVACCGYLWQVRKTGYFSADVEYLGEANAKKEA